MNANINIYSILKRKVKSKHNPIFGTNPLGLTYRLESLDLAGNNDFIHSISKVTTCYPSLQFLRKPTHQMAHSGVGGSRSRWVATLRTINANRNIKRLLDYIEGYIGINVPLPVL